MNQCAVKNIDYVDFDLIKKTHSYQWSEQHQLLIQALHKQDEDGIRLFVTKDVSNELIDTEIKNIEFEDIRWIANSVEFYFEDMAIPTLILALQESANHNQPFLDDIYIYKYVKDYKRKTMVQMVYMLNKNNERVHRFYNRFKEEIGKWGDPIETIDHEIKIRSGLKQTNSEEDYLKAIKNDTILFELVVKILLYVSLPQYKAIPTSEKSLRRCGKAGVKGRPKRPLFKTIFLPPVINVNKKSKATEDGGTRRPHFRRGHFRMLRDERFDKQGELIFVRPSMIHGGGIKDNLYVARKLNEAEK